MKQLRMAVALSVCLPGLMVASTIGTAYGSANGASYNRTPGQPSSCSYGGNGGLITDGSCNYTTNGTVQQGVGDSLFVNVASSVDAGGHLHGKASLSITNEPLGVLPCVQFQCSSVQQADAYAQSYDTYTFNPPGQQQTIQLILQLTVDGVVTTFNSNEAFGYARFDFADQYGYSLAGMTMQNGGTQVLTTPAITINAGSSFYYSVNMHILAELACTAQYGAPRLCTANTSQDYSNTAQITSIRIQDTQGNVLPGYTITSSSGVDYNSLIVGSVPEPGTVLFAFTGSVLCVIRLRRVPGVKS